MTPVSSQALSFVISSGLTKESGGGGGGCETQFRLVTVELSSPVQGLAWAGPHWTD